MHMHEEWEQIILSRTQTNQICEADRSGINSEEGTEKCEKISTLNVLGLLSPAA